MNKQIYIGSTDNLKKRLVDHNEGKVISTRRYRPWTLLYYEAYISEKLARIREKRLKHNGNASRELKERTGLIKSGAGFTLIEMIISLSIFVLIVLIVANIYVVINNSQKRVANMQKLQDDVRYAMESMAQEIRLGKINYSFYSNPAGLPGYSSAIDLHPSAAAPVTTLALTNQSDQRVFFNLDSVNKALRYCKEITTNDCNSPENWQAITPTGVIVSNLRFVITPSADPYTEVTQLTCSNDSECSGAYLSYRCAGTCKYFSDGKNFQPKVRIMMKTENTEAQKTSLTIQTTVSSRIIPSKVMNDNND